MNHCWGYFTQISKDLIEKGKIIEVASKIGDKKSKSIHEKNIEKYLIKNSLIKKFFTVSF